MAGQVIVSVSGITDETRDLAAGFAEEMDRRSVPLSLLVAPRLEDEYRLAADPGTQEWLRGRRDRGDAIVLHGFDQAATKSRRAEFAILPEHEARLRLLAADRVLEETGLRTRLFAPPRWVASPGAVAVLPSVGFRLLAGLNTIRDLTQGVSVRGTLIGLGDGFRAEPWRCRTMVLNASRGARRGRLVRLAISAKQLGMTGPRQAVLDAVDLTMHHGAEPTVYRWPLQDRVHEAA
ncbi:DUF2334 domain-containing protein [Rhodococcus spongiicola]|uniref:DUF2334 domain-containing protein n=1 Tax=Rhodococcus spongiicola TaxID=2487352 RepID=A0A438B6C1_9NOCA|nr:DUF2334 domain-containing protein [Rhodococcus spongiicola]RVW06490.1 DUF2334 domain-containing protein [Rhodococcus spongiicola]